MFHQRQFKEDLKKMWQPESHPQAIFDRIKVNKPNGRIIQVRYLNLRKANHIHV